jgi:cytochrome c-type biogenesis protein CcmE
MIENISSHSRKKNNRKFIIGGLMILAAVVYLIVSSTAAGAQYFFTVDEVVDRSSSLSGVSLRVSGAVVGDSIEYDSESLTLRFQIVNMPADDDLVNDEGGLAAALHAAVTDESRTRMQVEYIGVQPDLLRHEAQAILSGEVGEDGVFYANELLLRCPTRYEESVPDQVNS